VHAAMLAYAIFVGLMLSDACASQKMRVFREVSARPENNNMGWVLQHLEKDKLCAHVFRQLSASPMSTLRRDFGYTETDRKVADYLDVEFELGAKSIPNALLLAWNEYPDNHDMDVQIQEELLRKFFCDKGFVMQNHLAAVMKLSPQLLSKLVVEGNLEGIRPEIAHPYRLVPDTPSMPTFEQTLPNLHLSQLPDWGLPGANMKAVEEGHRAMFGMTSPGKAFLCLESKQQSKQKRSTQSEHDNVRNLHFQCCLSYCCNL
jgi:hypothetical protein